MCWSAECVHCSEWRDAEDIEDLYNILETFSLQVRFAFEVAC